VIADGGDEGGEVVGALGTEAAAGDGGEDGGQVWVEVVRGAVVVCVPQVFDVFGEGAEEEDVGFADFARDFDLCGCGWDCQTDGRTDGGRGGLFREKGGGRGTYVGAVAGADDEAAVEDELHVAGAAGLGAGGGDVLADVGGRGDDFGFADVVVLDEDDFEEVADVFVVVDDLADVVDQMDDGLRHPVAWCGFAPEDGDPRSELLPLFRSHGLDGQVAVDDAEDVELLPFVFVYALDLDVEQGHRVDADSCRVHDVLRQTDLVGVFDLLPFFPEVLVVDETLEFVQ